MDSSSSPKGKTPIRAPAPSSATKQPTYTTAGTIYDPSSATPIQPPARRGRALRATPTTHADPAFLPKPAFEAMPLKNTGSRTPSHHQYSPLQQNYDRAAGPSRDRESEYLFADMSSQTPRMRSGNTQGPLSFSFTEPDEQKASDPGSFGDEDQDDEDQSDSDIESNPLQGMTVKSLHNLASYPNPNQKRARRVLLRAAKTDVSELARNGAPYSTPGQLFGVAGSTSSLSHQGSIAASSNMLRSHIPNEPSSQWLPSSAPLRHAGSDFGTSPDVASARRPIQRNNNRAASPATPLTTGPGVPRPLTAGPPGQRQYRPSTFEATFKALQGNVTTPSTPADEDDEEALAFHRQILRQAGIDNIPFPTAPDDSARQGYDIDEFMSQSTSAWLSPPPDDAQRSLGPDPSPPMAANYASFIASLYATESAGPTRPASVQAAGYESLQTPVSEVNRYEPGTNRLSKEALAARNERISRYWYEGTHNLGRSMDDIIIGARQREMAPNLGVIGDGRPQKIKPENRPISIEEANRMSTAEHTEPLLNLAFANMLRQQLDAMKKGNWMSFHRAYGLDTSARSIEGHVDE